MWDITDKELDALEAQAEKGNFLVPVPPETLLKLIGDLRMWRNCILRPDTSHLLQWTNETPTEPGWYWYRLNEKDNNSMVYVDVYGTAITYYPNLCPDGWSRQNLKNMQGQWAGPVSEPREAK